MKKLLLTLLMVLIMSMSAFALSACSSTSDDDSGDGSNGGSGSGGDDSTASKTVTITMYETVDHDTATTKEMSTGTVFTYIPEDIAGYDFVAWSTDSAGTTAFDTTNITADVTIYACFTILDLSIFEGNADVIGFVDGAVVPDGHLQIPSVIGGITIKNIGKSDWSSTLDGTYTEVTIPSTVTNIFPLSFSQVTTLNKVNFAVEGADLIIHECAFQNTGITEIVIPSYVSSLGGASFVDCASLVTVEFLGTTPPTSWTPSWSATYEVFDNCTSLTHIYVDSSVVVTFKTALGDLGDTWADLIVAKA